MIFIGRRGWWWSDELVGGAGLRRRTRWAQPAIKGGLKANLDLWGNMSTAKLVNAVKYTDSKVCP